jgi:hypothetical protein
MLAVCCKGSCIVLSWQATDHLLCAVAAAAAAAAGVGGNIKFDASGDLIPDNKAYQSIKYNPTTGAVVYGSFLAIPPAK